MFGNLRCLGQYLTCKLAKRWHLTMLSPGGGWVSAKLY
jgi:hypothetical protein